MDAAYGGALIFSPTHHTRLNGIDLADSVTFNPQKWMYIGKTCAMVLFRDWRAASESVSITAPYAHAGTKGNLGEVHIQGTQYPDVLKLACSARSMGIAGYGTLVDRTMQLAQRMYRELHERKGITVLQEAQCNIVCFNITAQTQAANQALQHYLLAGHNVFIACVPYRDGTLLRVIPLNPYTSAVHVGTLLGGIDHFLSSRTSSGSP